MRGKRVLLIIGGGIAAYKSLELIRRLREHGASVRTILTRAGTEFVTPLSVASLAGEPVYQDLFSLTDESEMGHIELSRSTDVLVVAPATADLMAKMANGNADDLASTALLATDKPVLIAPAMNVRMWEHASTQRNLARLVADGTRVVGPNDGDMACGEFGPGRMAEPNEIVSAIEAMFTPGALNGFKALVTAGPTHEPIDPVRYIANRSSGKQGYAIAGALADAGANTVLVSGPVDIAAPARAKLVKVQTAREMLAACEAELPSDVAVCAAAVGDWRPSIAANSKMKKRDNGVSPNIALTENPDILSTLAHHKKRPSLVIGFAAETDDLLKNAASKRERKGADWIIANDVTPNSGVLGGIMGGDRTHVHIVTTDNIEDWPDMPKSEMARRLVARIAATFGKSTA